MYPEAKKVDIRELRKGDRFLCGDVHEIDDITPHATQEGYHVVQHSNVMGEQRKDTWPSNSHTWRLTSNDSSTTPTLKKTP